MIEMMEAIPLLTEDWSADFDILVLPLSLEKYWDAYWANDAPYYENEIGRNPETVVLTATDWIDIPEGTEYFSGLPILSRRILERDVRMLIPFTPKFCYLYVDYTLLVRNDTHITIKWNTYGDGTCPYTDTLESWVLYEAVTPDPTSNQIAHRMSW